MRYFLTIAASDTSGGAGIQQDLKMANKHGFWGLSIVTALTAQDFNNVYSMEPVAEKMIIDQCDAIFKNYEISAIKIGVIPNLAIAQHISRYLLNLKCPIVYDPVIKSTSGYDFASVESYEIIKTLCNYATVFTPNIPELEFLKNKMDIYSLKQLQSALRCSVYLKGGHGLEDSITEYLITSNRMAEFSFQRQKWHYTHGTGCAFASLLSMFLVDNEINKACELAHENLVMEYDKIFLTK